MRSTHRQKGNCKDHRLDRCRCGNILFDCGCPDDPEHPQRKTNGPQITTNHRICRCEAPGTAHRQRHTSFAESTSYTSVKKTWQDFECDQIDQQRYSDAKLARSHRERERRLGGRVTYE